MFFGVGGFVFHLNEKCMFCYFLGCYFLWGGFENLTSCVWIHSLLHEPYVSIMCFKQHLDENVPTPLKSPWPSLFYFRAKWSGPANAWGKERNCAEVQSWYPHIVTAWNTLTKNRNIPQVGTCCQANHDENSGRAARNKFCCTTWTNPCDAWYRARYKQNMVRIYLLSKRIYI